MKKPTSRKPSAKKGAPRHGASYSRFASTTDSSARRTIMIGKPRDAREDLSKCDRLKMIARSRWSERNSPLYAQVLREATMLVTGDDGLRAQSLIKDRKKARRYEQYFSDFAARCDITGRFTFGQVQQMSKHAKLADGDIGIIHTYDREGRPRVQLIEAHRIGTPEKDAPEGCIDGVVVSRYGEVTGYCVFTDTEKGWEFVPRTAMRLYANIARPSAYRGMPVAQSSFNSVQDQLEIFELEKRAVRDSADMTLILKKRGGIAPADVRDAFAGQAGDCSSLRNEVSQMGGKLLTVDVDEDFSQLENKRPNPAWLGMFKAIERDIVRFLPFEFVSDASAIGGAVVRLVTAKVSRWATHEQMPLEDVVCQPTWNFVIGWGIENGELPDDEDAFNVNWIRPRDITVDAGREAAQDRADLLMGLTTASAILSKKGMPIDDVQDVRVSEMSGWVEKAKAAGLPLWMVYQPQNNWMQQGQSNDQIPADVADNLEIPDQNNP